jgi:hypothetical protein
MSVGTEDSGGPDKFTTPGGRFGCEETTTSASLASKVVVVAKELGEKNRGPFKIQNAENIIAKSRTEQKPELFL